MMGELNQDKKPPKRKDSSNSIRQKRLNTKREKCGYTKKMVWVHKSRNGDFLTYKRDLESTMHSDLNATHDDTPKTLDATPPPITGK